MVLNVLSLRLGSTSIEVVQPNRAIEQVTVSYKIEYDW
jgi:hypothetical protein